MRYDPAMADARGIEPDTQPDMRLVILGGGGHARVLIDLARLSGLTVRCVLDDNAARHGTSLDGVPITDTIDQGLSQLGPAGHLAVNAVGSVGVPDARRAVYGRGVAAGFEFAVLVHACAVVAASARLGRGAQVLAGAVVGPGSVVGEDALINTRASVDHDCTVGPHCHLAPGVTLCGGVTLGPACHVGAGATVIQGRRIGAGSLIAAGAVVVDDLPAASRVRGVPARP